MYLFVSDYFFYNEFNSALSIQEIIADSKSLYYVLVLLCKIVFRSTNS